MVQLPSSIALSPTAPPEPDLARDRLADCVRRLDPGTRALLDLSVRRRLRDDAMAPLLRTDAFHLAWRRARALERVASDLGGDQPVPLAQVRAALETLPREAWDPLSVPALPRIASTPSPHAGSEQSEGTGTELVPVESGELVVAPTRVIERLDAFAQTAPTLRQAFTALGRALGRKAVRLVVWRRRG